jgi:hypothetical protein
VGGAEELPVDVVHLVGGAEDADVGVVQRVGGAEDAEAGMVASGHNLVDEPTCIT